MSGLQQAVKNQPFTISCPYCRQESFIEIGRARSNEELACECGARFDNIHLVQAAKQAETVITKVLHDAGFR